MKRLFFIVMAFFAFNTYAAESYRLPFVEIQNGTTKIPFIEQEWVLGTERADWLLYLEKGMLKDQKQPMYEFHGATVYKKPYYSDSVKTEISKIYTYGVLNCNEANLRHILFSYRFLTYLVVRKRYEKSICRSGFFISLFIFTSASSKNTTGCDV